MTPPPPPWQPLQPAAMYLRWASSATLAKSRRNFFRLRAYTVPAQAELRVLRRTAAAGANDQK